MPTIKKRGSAAPKQREQEIVTIAHALSRFFSSYRKQFTVGGAALILAAVLGAGYSIVRQRQEQKASPLVDAAYAVYQPKDGSPGNYQKALELFRDVRNNYPRTESGAVAQYYVGNCLVELDRREEAIREYEAFVNRYGGHSFLLGLVFQRLGFAYKEAGRLEDARKAFAQAETNGGPGIATWELAQLYEAAGDMPQAKKKYKEVTDKLTGTYWSVEAMGKVQKIEPAAVPATGGASAK